MPEIMNVDLATGTVEIEAYMHLPYAPAISDYQQVVQSLVDQTAASRQFNDGVTLASYVNSTIPQWKAEAEAFVAWRDQVWAYCYGELAKVQSGQRPQPSIEQFMMELPQVEWPQ